MINLHFGFEGIVNLHKGKYCSETESALTREHVTEFKNLILDTGLQRIGENGDWCNWLHLGSGTQAPHPLQNALQNATYKGSTMAPTNYGTTGINIEDPLNPYCWIIRVFRVPPRGENRTYSEMGVGWNDSNLFSRTLIKDPLGLPSSINILGDEYLDVTYEVRMYMPVNLMEYTVTPTGDDKEPRTIKVRGSMLNTESLTFGWTLGNSSNQGTKGGVALLNNWSSNANNRFRTGGIQGLYQEPAGTNVGSTFNYTSRLRTSDTSCEFQFTRELPDNIGHIKSIQISQQAYCFQMELDPPFDKSNEERFGFSYSISWGRRDAP